MLLRQPRSCLRSGAAVDAPKNDLGETALHDAARWNASATAEVLLGSGAAVDAKDKYGSTPLHDAAAANAFEAVEVLLGSGADRGCQKQRWFYGAARCGGGGECF